jgi:ribonuclease-3
LLAESRDADVAGGDYKSALQELLQGSDRPLPVYRLAGTRGPDHRKEFEVDVEVDGVAVARGTGGSKKDAEQDAAKQALEKLR